MSSQPRAFLKNMRRSRAREGLPRTLRPDELEARLDQYAQLRPSALNELRDAARALAPQLDADEEFARLDELISALSGTREGKLQTARGQPRAAGAPFDTARITRFEQLHQHLQSVAPPRLPPNPEHELSTLAFFEAYFSNFIGGTEFTLEEAERTTSSAPTSSSQTPSSGPVSPATPMTSSPSCSPNTQRCSPSDLR